jgi:protein-S-isoprenylcysteine O-methyltransferase Ste14
MAMATRQKFTHKGPPALFTLTQIIMFSLISTGLIIFSRRSLRNPHCHGFYRFFAFESIAILLVGNAPYWHHHPHSPLQLLSWGLLILSLIFVGQSFYLLRKMGGRRDKDINAENFSFENTETLISMGIYCYVRHPMYSSLILLAIGILLKNVTTFGLVVALSTCLFLIITAKIEEQENIIYFGQPYRDYMQATKYFFPLVL